MTGDFELTRDGVVESQSVVESPAGTYTFTVLAVATDEVWTARLYDTANTREIIQKDTDLYKSNTDSEVAV